MLAFFYVQYVCFLLLYLFKITKVNLICVIDFFIYVARHAKSEKRKNAE